MKHIKKFIFILPFVFIPKLVFALCFVGCDEGWSLDDITGLGLPGPETGIAGILAGLLSWLLLIIGIISVMAFVVSGIIYITSAGDEEQAKRAKRAVTNSVIGIVVALIGYAVVNLVFGILTNGSGDM
jgi:cytochrome bd-type quinol oxidase subunit 2